MSLLDLQTGDYQAPCSFACRAAANGPPSTRIWIANETRAAVLRSPRMPEIRHSAPDIAATTGAMKMSSVVNAGGSEDCRPLHMIRPQPPMDAKPETTEDPRADVAKAAARCGFRPPQLNTTTVATSHSNSPLKTMINMTRISTIAPPTFPARLRSRAHWTTGRW